VREAWLSEMPVARYVDHGTSLVIDLSNDHTEVSRLCLHEVDCTGYPSVDDLFLVASSLKVVAVTYHVVGSRCHMMAMTDVHPAEIVCLCRTRVELVNCVVYHYIV
jgi:hypothetical protein